MKEKILIYKKASIIFIFSWMIIISILRVLQYFSFGTNTYDLGIYYYAFNNTLHGKLFFEPFHGIFTSHFGVHFTPTLLLLVPIYAIFQHPLALMLFQVIFVGVSAYFLYKICLLFIDEKKTFIVIIIYLLFRQLLSGTMYDFHPIALFPLLFFAFYYEILTKKRVLIFTLLLILILGLKEDLSLYMIFFGVILFFKYNKKAGLLTFLYALLYFPAVYFVILPLFYTKGGFYLFFNWSHLGNSFVNVIKNLILHPIIAFKMSWFGKGLLKLLNFFAPLLFVEFLAIDIIPIFIPVLVLLTSKRVGMHYFQNHYCFYLLPFLFISFVQGLKVLEKKLDKKSVFYGMILILIINIGNSSIYKLLDPKRYKNIKYYRYVKTLNKELESYNGQKIFIQSSIIPTLKKNNDFQMLKKKYLNKKDILIIVNPALNPWPLTTTEIKEIIDKGIILKKMDGFYILSVKKHSIE
ncbi:DUF2079 domain-containing protein [bacterium]|nr:DUF2079 domain-containing protein [bacterium]